MYISVCVCVFEFCSLFTCPSDDDGGDDDDDDIRLWSRLFWFSHQILHIIMLNLWIVSVLPQVNSLSLSISSNREFKSCGCSTCESSVYYMRTPIYEVYTPWSEPQPLSGWNMRSLPFHHIYALLSLTHSLFSFIYWSPIFPSGFLLFLLWLPDAHIPIAFHHHVPTTKMMMMWMTTRTTTTLIL